MDLDEMMGFLISTGQVDETLGLKEKKEETNEPEDDE